MKDKIVKIDKVGEITTLFGEYRIIWIETKKGGRYYIIDKHGNVLASARTYRAALKKAVEL